MQNSMNKYFKLNNSWGCRPDSNYLLSSFTSLDTTVMVIIYTYLTYNIIIHNAPAAMIKQ